MMNKIQFDRKRRRLVALCLCSVATLSLYAQGIHVTPRSMEVRSDSLRVFLDIDFSDIRLNASTAVTFTPLLSGATAQVELAPVIVSGRKRFRFDRRSYALESAHNRPFTAPLMVLVERRRTPLPAKVAYQISVPFASWMQGASLLLRQEMKDCCDLQLLGVDTLVQHLTVTGASGAVLARPLTSALPVAIVSRPPSTAVAVSAPIVQLLPTTEANFYVHRVSFLQPDVNNDEKRNTERATLYIDYPIGQHQVLPHYRNNSAEIAKIDSILSPLLTSQLSKLESIRVCGYSSPDGTYQENTLLADARSRLFTSYLHSVYHLSRQLIEVTHVPEDWDGLERLLRQDCPSYAEAALNIIRRYGIFSGREKQLMDLQGGVPYRNMLQQFFPLLRRIEVSVQYSTRAVSGAEAVELIYTHPELLSLSEMYAAARYYRAGTEQYREVYEIAAYRFPDDVVANINAASAVMITGDLQSAEGYLRKAANDPRAWNNLGMLAYMKGETEQAATWFRKAVGIEPQKARNNLRMMESGSP